MIESASKPSFELGIRIMEEPLDRRTGMLLNSSFE